MYSQITAARKGKPTSSHQPLRPAVVKPPHVQRPELGMQEKDGESHCLAATLLHVVPCQSLDVPIRCIVRRR